MNELECPKEFLIVEEPSHGNMSGLYLRGLCKTSINVSSNAYMYCRSFSPISWQGFSRDELQMTPMSDC